ncbi:MAG: DUF4974 domain-containing protein [Rhodothermales bacterium]|nr:DUF4974 domain-containing protein [Rhodothermales bacterium]
MKTTDKELLLRSFDVEPTEAERERIEHLLETDPEARSLDRSEVEFREAVSRSSASTFGNSFASEVMAATESTPSILQWLENRLPALNGPAFPRLAVAASLVLLLAVATVVTISLTRSTENTLTATIGSTHEAILPDGTVVVLNSGSTIKYDSPFKQSRHVRLVGEAFFDVVENGSSFEVETDNATLTVLGTSFNVRSWPNLERETVVTLHSGSLDVRDQDNRSVRMSPGDRVVLSDTKSMKTERIEPARLPDTVAWRNGVVAFDREPFGFAMAELSRMYGVSIKVTNQELSERRITYLPGQSEPIETVLANICNAFSVRFLQTADGYNIVSE